eukprot:Nk52_evm3s1401 gene=Nk52_evmTU3s1401
MGVKKLLIWKFWVLKKRAPVATTMELVVPLLFFIIMAAIRVSIKSEDVAEQSFEPSSNAPFGAADKFDSKKIAYGPNTSTAVVELMRDYVAPLMKTTIYPDNNTVTAQSIFLSVFEGYAVEDDAAGTARDDPEKYAGAIWMEDMNLATVLPALVKYDIRLTTTSTPKTKDLIPERKDEPVESGPNTNTPYYSSGFIYIQFLIDRSITNMKLQSQGKGPLTELTFNQLYPYPAYVKDEFSQNLGVFLPLFMTLGWIYSVSLMVKNIVYEKEKRLREALKLAGVKQSTIWLGWWINHCIFIFISTFVALLIMGGASVFENSDMSCITVFFLLFAVATISFSHLMSTIFSRAKVAAASAAVIYYVTYIPYTFLERDFETQSAGTKTGVCMFSTSCFGIGAKVLSIWEERGIGIKWSNLSDNPDARENYSMGQVFGMLLFDTVLYILLTWYIEGVFPGQYGLPQKWYFPVSPQYWKGQADEGSTKHATKPAVVNEEFVEPEPVDSKIGIRIEELTKVYDEGKKCAVNNLSVNMIEGQITSFLGHNGAGKTTTMSILCGLFPATSGRAEILGHDISTDMEAIKKDIGFCPQFDILYDRLTVEEHLSFYCQLKKVDPSIIPQEIDGMLADLNLENKRQAWACTLSGGMKRKLSVALSLVGGSRVVILDEPTAGMDPYSRRSTWDLLLKHKPGRTMLLSTHFMDEADLLGDRIVIIANGKLRCAGSSMFLKSVFGVGYHLDVVKTGMCEEPRVTNLIKSFASEGSLVSNVGAELQYILPSAAKGMFGPLLKELEDKKIDIGIDSYGLSLTTMEEVFLKVSDLAENEQNPRKSSNRRISGGRVSPIEGGDETQSGAVKNNSNGEKEFGTSSSVSHSLAKLSNQVINNPDVAVEVDEDAVAHKEVPLFPRNRGMALKKQQFKAMFIKRWLNAKRDGKAAASQLLLPAVFTLIGMILANAFPPDTTNPKLLLTVPEYDTNTVFWQNNNASAFSAKVYQNLQTQNLPNSAKVNVPTTGNFTAVMMNSIGAVIPSYGSFHTGPVQISNLTQEGYVAYYNNEAWHSQAQYCAILDDLLLKTALDSTSEGIYVYNYPLPKTAAEQEQDIVDQATGLSVAIMMIFGFAFLAGSVAVFVVYERTTNSKHLQFISGVNPWSFWCGTFLWDILNYLLTVLVVEIIILAFQESAYTGTNFAPQLLLLILFGWAVIPLMYVMSTLFTQPTTAYVVLISFNVLIGLATTITTFALDAFDSESLTNANDALKWVFLLVPNYALGRGLMDLAILDAQSQVVLIGNDKGIDFKVDSPWEFDITGRNYLFLALEGVALFVLTLMIEYGMFSVTIRGEVNSERENSNAAEDSLDSDVLNEKRRVEEGAAKDDSVVLCGLSKQFRQTQTGKVLTAVDNLSLGIPAGECFGLLGVNGAGKTTTFKMLTGDISVGAGDAQIMSYDLKTESKLIHQEIGYCPQFDAVLDLMSARESIRMFAMMRGIQESQIDEVVSNMIDLLSMSSYCARPCGSYSGGQRRALSTALALIGSPAVIFLDEPTTGMDPKARRFLWGCITRIMHSGRAIVLTSHSMEECEALCTRLAIMVNGQFRCLGSPQHLKNKFGEGYTLTMKVNDKRHIQNCKDFVIQNLHPNAELKEEHSQMVVYRLPLEQLSLASIFTQLEDIKTEYGIEDYSVSQTTLEQVFVSFASSQDEEKSLK